MMGYIALFVLITLTVILLYLICTANELEYCSICKERKEIVAGLHHGGKICQECLVKYSYGGRSE